MTCDKFQTNTPSLKNGRLTNYGQISFYLGTFFLASALPISCIFFLISIFFSIINKKYYFIKCNWNKFLLFISGILVLISVKFYFTNHNINFDQLEKTSSLVGLFNDSLFLIFILFQKYLENEQKVVFSKFLVAGLIPLIFSCILQSKLSMYGPWIPLVD